MRRRRLDAFRNGPPWPGKARAQAREEAQYDHCLVVAAHMLEVRVPDREPRPGQPLPPASSRDRRRAAAGARDTPSGRWPQRKDHHRDR